jgi:hypothetical protein
MLSDDDIRRRAHACAEQLWAGFRVLIRTCQLYRPPEEPRPPAAPVVPPLRPDDLIGPGTYIAPQESLLRPASKAPEQAEPTDAELRRIVNYDGRPGWFAFDDYRACYRAGRASLAAELQEARAEVARLKEEVKVWLRECYIADERLKAGRNADRGLIGYLQEELARLRAPLSDERVREIADKLCFQFPPITSTIVRAVLAEAQKGREP